MPGCLDELATGTVHQCLTAVLFEYVSVCKAILKEVIEEVEDPIGLLLDRDIHRVNAS